MLEIESKKLICIYTYIYIYIPQSYQRYQNPRWCREINDLQLILPVDSPALYDSLIKKSYTRVSSIRKMERHAMYTCYVIHSGILYKRLVPILSAILPDYSAEASRTPRSAGSGEDSRSKRRGLPFGVRNPPVLVRFPVPVN